jgi:hypothetical protein
MSEETRPTTELQFLIDLLLNHKLRPETKKLVADRIGTVESSLRILVPKNPQEVPRGTSIIPNLAIQAPSTQRALERDAIVNAPVPASAMVGPAQPRAVVTPAAPFARVPEREVSTGHGTRGPRKF